MASSAPVTVVFASDARGILPLSAAAWSVAEQAAPDTVCDICILSDGIPAAEQEKLRALIRRAGERHGVRFLDIAAVLPEGLMVMERWPRVAWARVFLPDLLPEVHRAVYLDIDTLCCADLRPLVETDMGGAAMGVVLEHESHEGSHFNERLDIPQCCPGYFNSGVLLMDLDVFRREGLVKKVLDFAASHYEVLTCPDQDALNGALCDRLFQLHPRWNWHDGLTRLILKKNPNDKLWRGNSPVLSVEAALSPAVLHYQGKNKPWRYNHRIERERYEQSMLRAGLIERLPLPGFTVGNCLKRFFYRPLYALTWRRIGSLAVRLGARRGEACGTAARAAHAEK